MEERQKHFEGARKVPPPLRHLIHGLPGSGKSELLRWIRSYFEEVWQWSYGAEFVFLAPLNSMANNIGGSTVHSWGQIGFKDRRGVRIAPKTAENEETPAMTIKCGKLRFVCIDEIEATGAETIGALEAHISFHISSKSPYKYECFYDETGKLNIDHLPRPFGGVNVLFLGDFWQLNPHGQIAIMSNPYGEKVLESAKANYIMRMFWGPNEEGISLLPWEDKRRILHLARNERSGNDEWFSQLLNACRNGNLSEDDYNYLHGYPTEATITFWYAHRSNTNWKHSELCRYSRYHVLDHWNECPSFECIHCWQERKRRARVLHLGTHASHAREQLADPRFAESVLITQYNVAVFYFAQARCEFCAG